MSLTFSTSAKQVPALFGLIKRLDFNESRDIFIISCFSFGIPIFFNLLLHTHTSKDQILNKIKNKIEKTHKCWEKSLFW